MKLLTLSQWRYFRFAPWSTLTVLLGVSLAVTSIVAVHQISQRVVASLEAVTPAYLRDVTHILTRPDQDMSGYFELRARWRAGELPGVVSMMPLVDGPADSPSGSVRVVGVDAFSGVRAAAGLALLSPREAVIGGADDNQEQLEALRVNEIPIRIAFVHSGLPDGMLVTDIGTAQRILGLSDGALDAVAVQVASPGQTLIRWLDRLLPGFSAGVEFEALSIPGWQVQSLAESLPSLAFARSVLFNLGALGTLALVVAWLLVYQVSVIWLRRRAPTLNYLLQLGVLKQELMRTFLLSLCTLGLLASLLGLFLGEQLAVILSRAATGFSEGRPEAPLDVWVLVKALGSSVGVCLIGGWLAFRREFGKRFLQSERGMPFWVSAGALIIVGAWGLFSDESLLGGFVAIAALALFVILIIRPLLERLRRSSRLVRGRLLTRIGLRELFWYPGDLSVAIGALVLAIATSVAMALMVDSFRADFETMLDQRMVHDLFISSSGEDLTGLAERLAVLPDVRRVQRYGRADVRLAGRAVSVSFSRFDETESRRYGLAQPLARGECLVSERLARIMDLGVGRTVAVAAGACRVAGVFSGFGDSVPRLLLGDADAVRFGLPGRYDRLSIDTDDTAGVMVVVRRLAPDVVLEEQRAVRERALLIFDQTFAITRALTLLALLVASVGLYNALLALEILQQPSRLLLQAMGLNRAERRAVAGWRVAAVGSTALLLALPLGIAMGWLLCAVINPRAFGWSLHLTLQLESFFWPLVTALIVMLLAAVAPMPKELGERAGEVGQ